MPSLSWIFAFTLSMVSEALLVRWDAFFVLDFCLHVVYGVRGLHIKRDRLPRQRLHKDLHAAAQPEHQMQRRLLLDIVVRQRAAIFELLPRENQALLVRRDAFFVLNFGLHVVYGVRGLDIKRDRLPRQRLHEDLHLVRKYSLESRWARRTVGN